MQISVTHSPSYAMATVVLDHRESILAEGGAMVAMSEGVRPSISSGGGVMRALGRKLLSQESLFLTKFTATQHGAWVSLAPRLPGDVIALELPPEGLLVQSGSFLAASESVDLSTEFAGASRIIGREGAFMVGLSGVGQAVLTSYGAMQRVDLGTGQRITVDTGHFVASSAHMRYQLGMLEGIVTSALSKEGLVANFEGPGSVWMQTRSPVELQSWIFPDRPQDA